MQLQVAGIACTQTLIEIVGRDRDIYLDLIAIVVSSDRDIIP